MVTTLHCVVCFTTKLNALLSSLVLSIRTSAGRKHWATAYHGRLYNNVSLLITG